MHSTPPYQSRNGGRIQKNREGSLTENITFRQKLYLGPPPWQLLPDFLTFGQTTQIARITMQFPVISYHLQKFSADFRQIPCPFHAFSLNLPYKRRDGRVVDYSSLENCRTERYRGFESLSLRITRWFSAGFLFHSQFYSQKSRLHRESHTIKIAVNNWKRLQLLVYRITAIFVSTPNFQEIYTQNRK